MSFEKDAKEAANEEGNKAWLWAMDHLKTTEPVLAYEWGVKAGYQLGAEFGYRMAIAELRTCDQSPTALKYPGKWVDWLLERAGMKK